MIYLDTNVVIPLFAGKPSVLSLKARKAITRSELLVSPMVKLELQYLYELGKISIPADAVIHQLAEAMALSVAQHSFHDVCRKAESMSWTRDTFDRLIVAEAALANAVLVTSDRVILKHYKKALW